MGPSLAVSCWGWSPGSLSVLFTNVELILLFLASSLAPSFWDGGASIPESFWGSALQTGLLIASPISHILLGPASVLRIILLLSFNYWHLIFCCLCPCEFIAFCIFTVFYEILEGTEVTAWVPSVLSRSLTYPLLTYHKIPTSLRNVTESGGDIYFYR